MKWIEKTNLCFEAENDVFTLAIITPEFNNDPKQISITVGKRIGHHLSLRRFHKRVRVYFELYVEKVLSVNQEFYTCEGQ